MTTMTAATQAMRAEIATHRKEIEEVLQKYGAHHPRIFGSVARGDAKPSSDLDILVDLDPFAGNELMRVAGMSEELSGLLHIPVDVVAPSLLRNKVSQTALADAVTL